MARIISIHEYDLKPGSNPARFEQALRDAEARGLFNLPGLMAHHFVTRVKGSTRSAYAAVWVYESREAWERLWGTLEHPREPTENPAKWRIWGERRRGRILSRTYAAIRFN